MVANHTMEQCIFAFSLIIEGTTEKVLQFIMPLRSIYNRNFGFTEQKNVFLNTTESFKQEKLLIDNIFATKKIYVDCLKAAPYLLM
jgi:hypothetical protein